MIKIMLKKLIYKFDNSTITQYIHEILIIFKDAKELKALNATFTLEILKYIYIYMNQKIRE